MFRVDDGPGIGAGHLMRCLALAEAIVQEGGEVWLVTARESVFHERWRTLNAHVVLGIQQAGSEEDLAFTTNVCTRVGADWVIVDGYRFVCAWLDEMGSRAKTLWVDDLGLYDPAVALVLNHNPGADQRFAARYKRCRQSLLGLEWFLLRREFWRQESIINRNGILICLGGEDTDDRVSQIVQAIASVPKKLTVDVVGSVSTSRLKSLADITKNSESHFKLHEGPIQLAPLMSRARVMICGGGVTALEALSMGLRIVILVLADNQAEGAIVLARMSQVRVVEAVDDWANKVVCAALQLSTDAERTQERHSLFLDGLGARRVLEQMRCL